MNTFLRLLAGTAVAALLSACTTMNFSAYKFEKLGVETVRVVPKEGTPWGYDIYNETDDDLLLSFQKSAFVLNGDSYRVVSGDSKIIKMDQASTDVPVAPQAKTSVIFLPPDLLNLKYDKGWKIEWKQYPKDGDKYEFRFVFAKNDGKVLRSTLSGTVHAFHAPVSDANKYACWGTAIFYGGWCWFLPTSSDLAAGSESAKKKYGEDVIVEYRNRGP